MSNSFEPPKIEKRNNTVSQQVSAQAKMDKVIGVPSEVTVTDAASIYMNGIDTFVKFLRGEHAAGTLEERKKFQLEFFDSIWPMLRLDDAQVKRVLDHFLITITGNPDAFEYSTVLRPLYAVETQRPKQDIEKYKRFILFMITLAENARDRQRFLKQFDMVKFSNSFDPIAKQRLTNYIYR